MKLVLIRHGESVWNRENRFTGWTDVDLSEMGKEEAADAGRLLKQEGFDFDRCYTSYLKRAIHTLNLVLEQMDREWLPVEKSWKLNERHYGALQGLNKAETANRYGEEQVKLWRRSFAVKPPLLAADDERSPALLPQYRGIDPGRLPLAESLEDTIQRTIPYFEESVKPAMTAGKRVLIAAHGNSLRALVMYLEQLTQEEITEINLPTGIPLVYELNSEFRVTDKRYLGDPDAAARKIRKVAEQGTVSGSRPTPEK